MRAGVGNGASMPKDWCGESTRRASVRRAGRCARTCAAVRPAPRRPPVSLPPNGRPSSEARLPFAAQRAGSRADARVLRAAGVRSPRAGKAVACARSRRSRSRSRRRRRASRSRCVCGRSCSRCRRVLQDSTRWAAARRGWFNLLQFSAARPAEGAHGEHPAGLWANNVISDPVCNTTYFFGVHALLVPELAPACAPPT